MVQCSLKTVGYTVVASQNRLVGVYRGQEELCLERKYNFKSPCQQSLLYFKLEKDCMN